MKVLPDKLVAFVQYRLRVSAEFAKEAMHERILEHDDEVRNGIFFPLGST